MFKDKIAPWGLQHPPAAWKKAIMELAGRRQRELEEESKLWWEYFDLIPFFKLVLLIKTIWEGRRTDLILEIYI
ncbi:MAG: hypothetical protein JXB60_01755 [Candidatus Cloacimonetes bacterium]|nr:hypothetical protein [Candidatus Cloacimonadota bacterium]